MQTIYSVQSADGKDDPKVMGCYYTSVDEATKALLWMEETDNRSYVVCAHMLFKTAKEYMGE